MKFISIKTEYIPLCELLKYGGLTMSGGEGKEAVSQGLVKVNGEVCTVKRKKIYPGTEVSYDGETLKVV